MQEISFFGADFFNVNILVFVIAIQLASAIIWVHVLYLKLL